ncbi:hypothetical protein K2X40_01680 [Candidatus Babeliales bacterium]|nr:hypothetical protein [Candidatus Babeliales bacterium]
MKKLNYLLLTLGLAASSLRGAASSSSSSSSSSSHEEEKLSKQELEQRMNEYYVTKLIFQEAWIENEVQYLMNLKKQTSDATALANLTAKIRAYNTQRIAINNAIDKHNKASFFKKTEKDMETMITTIFTYDSCQLKKALEQNIQEASEKLEATKLALKSLTEPIEKTPKQNTGLGITPRPKPSNKKQPAPKPKLSLRAIAMQNSAKLQS